MAFQAVPGSGASLTHIAHLCACSECAGRGVARIGISRPPGSLGLPRQDVLVFISSVSAHPLNECMDTPRGGGCLKPLAAHSPWQGLFQMLPTRPTSAVPNTSNTSRGCSCLGDALGMAFPMPEPGEIPWASLAGLHLAGLYSALRRIFTLHEVPRVQHSLCCSISSAA